jgi:hypothetical protein
VPSGGGWTVHAPHLYVWEETLSEARDWGVELGVLPAQRTSSRRSDYGAAVRPGESEGRAVRVLSARTRRAAAP